MKFAISQEGADAMRQLSIDISSSIDGIQQSTATLKNQIMGYMHSLGVYGPEIWAVALQMESIIEDKRDALNELAGKARNKSDEILGIIDGISSVATQGSCSGRGNNGLSESIAGVKPEAPMSFKEADTGHVNPNYGMDDGYSYNCQSCVAVFEARLRGYDVQVLPNTSGSMLEKVSHQTNMVWIDPETGNPPSYIYDDSLTTAEEYVGFIDNTVKQGNRYTIQFLWKGRKNEGHIVNLDRNEYGELRIKDNQRGMGERSEWLGTQGVLEYLSDVKFEDTAFFGMVRRCCVPQMLRIDNMRFNTEVASQIMEGAIL